MAERLLGKIVLITGASSGIGKACAFEFAKSGSSLILAARRSLDELTSELAAKFPKIHVKAIQLDIRDRQGVFTAINSLPDSLKDIDVVVNNAGLVHGVDLISDVSEEDYHVMFDTNVRGLLNVTQAVLPVLKAKNSGHVINISSISGTEVYPGGGVYCASKHAVDAITRTLRMELVATGINVASIDPGMVETEFSVVRFGGDVGRAKNVYKGIEPLTGEDIAETVVFVASRKPHVNIAKMLVLPTQQAAVHLIHRQ